jgi:hypothetical protein
MVGRLRSGLRKPAPLGVGRDRLLDHRRVPHHRPHPLGRMVGMNSDQQQRHERDVKDARNTAAELQRVLRENRELRKRIEELEGR